MSAVRGVLVLAGVVLMATGAWFLTDNPDLPRVGLWFAAPVLVHDALLAPVALAVGWLVARVVPPVARGPVLAGLVVTLALTVLALPALLRPEPYPATLLDRDYVAGYGAALLVTWGLVLGTVAVRLARRQRRRPADEFRRRPPSVGSTDTGHGERGGP